MLSGELTTAASEELRRADGTVRRRPPSEAICPKTRWEEWELGPTTTTGQPTLGPHQELSMQGGPEACLGGPRKQVLATWDVSRARCDGGDVNPRRPDRSPGFTVHLLHLGGRRHEGRDCVHCVWNEDWAGPRERRVPGCTWAHLAHPLSSQGLRLLPAPAFGSSPHSPLLHL